MLINSTAGSNLDKHKPNLLLNKKQGLIDYSLSKCLFHQVSNLA
jgi:hypothetical protein